MVAPTPKRALDALTAQARIALQCIAEAEVLSTDSPVGLPNNLQIVPFRKPLGSTLLLQNTDRVPFLQLEIFMEYTVLAIPDAVLRPGFEALVTMYMYGILDLAGRELFAYHWHPAGVSAVGSPHFHASTTPPIVLPVRLGHSETTRLSLNRIHFPPHHIELTELMRFLITELGVGPRRPDWERVLDRIEQTSR